MELLEKTNVVFSEVVFLYQCKRGHGIDSVPVFKKVMQVIAKVTLFTGSCIAGFFFFLEGGGNLFKIGSLCIGYWIFGFPCSSVATGFLFACRNV